MTENLAFINAEAPVFRPVHYLGCKLRVIDALSTVVQELERERGTLLDLFSGTGVVAAHFARSRSVVAADIQEYARVLASALLAPSAPSSREIRAALDATSDHGTSARGSAFAGLIDHEHTCLDELDSNPDTLCSILEDGSLVRFELEGAVQDDRLTEVLGQAACEIPAGSDTALTRHYGGVYFSYEQALVLDALAVAVREWASPAREVGLAAVMSTASELVSSVGNHFAQPLRPRDKSGRPKLGMIKAVARRRRASARSIFIERLNRYAALPAPAHDATAIRADFREVLSRPPDSPSIVYADPPYTRDHYSRYYHVLETIALGDEPGMSLMRLGERIQVSRGLYRLDRHQSPFSIKSQAPEAFRQLFAGVRKLDAPLVLSYSPYGEGSASRPRLMAIDQLVGLASEFFSVVEVVSAGRLMHSRLNAAHLNSDPAYDAEQFIVCRA